MSVSGFEITLDSIKFCLIFSFVLPYFERSARVLLLRDLFTLSRSAIKESKQTNYKIYVTIDDDSTLHFAAWQCAFSAGKLSYSFRKKWEAT